MLPPVFQTLKASAEVKAIVGTSSPRIFRHGEADPSKVRDANGAWLPYLTWLLISGVPENNLEDPSPVARQSVQIDGFHPTDAGIEALADAVRDALEPLVHITTVRNPPREQESRLFRFSLDADFWGR